MVGEHYPSGWNHKQVSIDFIEGTGSLAGRVINSTAAGRVVELVPEGEPREPRARRVFFTHGPPYNPLNCWRSRPSGIAPRLWPGLPNHRSTPSLRESGGH